MAKTLRQSVIDTINDLNILVQTNLTIQQRDRIYSQIDVLFTQLRSVTRFELNKQSLDYKAAIETVNRASKAAKEAKKDIAKVAEVIESVADAIGKIESGLSKALKYV